MKPSLKQPAPNPSQVLLSGCPEGVAAVRLGHPRHGEYFLDGYGAICLGPSDIMAYVIVEPVMGFEIVQSGGRFMPVRSLETPIRRVAVFEITNDFDLRTVREVLEALPGFRGLMEKE